MRLYSKIINKQEKIAVIGMGYVGMPLAVSFSKFVDVIGYDISREKIQLLNRGIDPTNEVGDEEISNSTIVFTHDEELLKKAKFHIIAVPTPINLDKTPDLSPVVNASKTLARNLVKGSIVVYESTVYPGVTEEICIPILEQESGLKCGVDFKVGYSPERINPGDKIHRLDNITKIVSAIDSESLEEISKTYEIVIKVGVHRTSSIKVAEAAKVIENSQRDINIAFMNEIAMVFDRMGIDTNEVIEAMNTKWNALGFRPGLVGGHCIGVDPYYFVYRAENLGYHSQIILAGRKVNDAMGEFIADAVIKKLVLANKVVRKSKVVIMGLTFKENCPDIRNSKVEDIIVRLREYGIEPIVVDPWANALDAKQEYDVKLVDMKEVSQADCVVFAVAHNEFKQLNWSTLDDIFIKGDPSEKVIIDVKGIFDKNELERRGYSYWRL